MELSKRRAGDVVVVDVNFGVDLGTSLMDLVTVLLDEGERRILLNLLAHRFDSNALGQATGCWIRANHRGGVLKIATRQPKVWELLSAVRLDRVVDCYRSEEEALESFGHSTA